MTQRILIIILCALLSTSAFAAECPMESMQVRGKVQLGKTALPGATVSIRWDEASNNNLSAQARTQEDGSFEVDLLYSTSGGNRLFGDDKCDYKLKKVAIEVRHESARDFGREYKTANLKSPVIIKARRR